MAASSFTSDCVMASFFTSDCVMASFFTSDFAVGGWGTAKLASSIHTLLSVGQVVTFEVIRYTEKQGHWYLVLVISFMTEIIH